METVTLGQIALAVTFLVGLMSGIGYLDRQLKIYITQALGDPLTSIKTEISGLQDRIDAVDISATKNYLVTFLSEVDQGQQIDEIEVERFWEAYQHYEVIGGNSYIKRKVETLKSEGRL